MKKYRKKRSRFGFSLIEVMISASISGLVVTSSLGFYITLYKVGFVNQERNEINSDIRNIVGRLVDDGRSANYFVLYNSAAPTERDESSDRLLDGESGDFVVFVTSEETGNITRPTAITKIVCYYRATSIGAANELAPVHRVEKTFNPGTSDELETLLPDEVDMILADEVTELSRGLADGRLFYNFWGRSIMVNGQIHHGNDAKRVTETYNFTISPRG